jgi:hypothetical protein
MTGRRGAAVYLDWRAATFEWYPFLRGFRQQ